MLAASEMDCQELPCTRAQRATHFKRCLRSKTGCRALPLHASVLAASEMDCQELPCARPQRATHFSHSAEHFIEPWSAELLQSPVKIAGQITLRCQELPYSSSRKSAWLFGFKAEAHTAVVSSQRYGQMTMSLYGRRTSVR
ncbi:unnamed protein product [Effrenium voratum]|uniref:Uncharacterized protein n=1 Tax=Effrenium voratum TaxID=2562239 RepID=A0AA36NEV1_9DINO|nr:unnamed protein product [Effrenium voratum]